MTPPPIVSLVGKSGAGKTTFMEKLIPALVRRGYAVGAIKHHAHRGLDFDVEGKDSWRHKRAGARQSIVSGPDKLALVRDADHDAGLSELRDAYGRGLDLILSEGYKREAFPKVEVFRKGVHESLLCEGDEGLIAVVTDADVAVDAPKFGLDDAEGVADLIEDAFLRPPAAPPRIKGGPIPFEEALEIVRRSGVLLEPERVPLGESLGRVLRRDALSDMDVPPFDTSAADGFACRRCDLPGPLEVVETVPAGKPPSRGIGPGQAARIMTGAMLPEGADCVFMLEQSRSLPDGRVMRGADARADSIRRRGEDVRAGDLLAASGTRITPRAAAALALAGCVEPLVSRWPVVGVLTTGDELVPAGARPGRAQIRDTNSIQSMTAAAAFGCDVRSYGILRDESAAVSSAVGRAAAECGVLLITGGVAMGDFDLVPGGLRKAGFELLFEEVAVRPGARTVFGRRGDAVAFGLPGSPGASFLVFEFLVKELLAAMMGLTERPPTLRCPLARGFSRREADRLARVPVRLTPEGLAEAVERSASARLAPLAAADGAFSVPAGVASVEKGRLVDVRLFR